EEAKANEKLAEMVDQEAKKGAFLLILGGDHSIAIGSLSGIAHHYEHVGVIWYDAHGELDTEETSPYGNIHGMSLAVSLDLGEPKLVNILNYAPNVKHENIVINGARSFDEGEKELIKEKGIMVYTMHEIDRKGMSHVMEDAITYLESKTDGVHLSLD